jgi:ParB family chromosome partitioning protein
VQIKLKAKDKGQVVIAFDTNDDFERIVDTFRKAA